MDSSAPSTVRRYILIMIAVYAGWIGLYFLTSWIGEVRGPLFDPAIALDAAIPFVPEFQYVYMLAYVVVFGLFLVSREPAFLNRAYTAFIIANGAAFVLFALFPTQGPVRDALPVDGSLSNAFLSFIFSIDSRYNALPSLHVTNPWLVAMFAARMRGADRISVPLLLVAVLITASTLFVHQHYILDAVGGMVLAAIVYAVVQRMKISADPW